ncbi:MAG: hypothetical protein N3G19_01590 [Candidatus Pacearchaeota archaeon]|nr:hypothetical protein [Candidatus Pacearchaeota archaeon]
MFGKKKKQEKTKETEKQEENKEKKEKIDEREIKEKISKGWIRAVLIIQILGKPVDHIEKTLDLATDYLAKDGRAILIEKKVYPAKLVEGTENVFTTFTEVEILVSGISKLIELIFDYMPASVEILEPSSFSLKLEDANSILNDLAARIHHYDALLKKSRLELNVLVNKFKELEEKAKEKFKTEEEKKE